MMVFMIWAFFIAAASLVNGEYTDPQCLGGSRVFVHLVEWKWSDIERECPLLADLGYCGIMTPVPTEHYNKSQEWWERYLPVSYLLETRSGDEDAFKSMVKACNDAGIRVVVDIELNHMSSDTGIGIAGTFYDATTQDYPGVPYNASHFHGSADCSGQPLTGSSPASDMQGCRLMSYPDLDQSNPYVREMLTELLNSFISMGVAGFHFEDALQIAPEDIKKILEQVDDVQWGGRPFVINKLTTTMPTAVKPEWFFPVGRVTEYTFAEALGEALIKTNDLSKLCDYLTSPSLLPDNQSVVFVDELLYQRERRPPWSVTVTFKSPKEHIIAESILLASGFGVPKILSSYEFSYSNQGPPSDQFGNILDVVTAADGSCGNGWVCEHRWPEIEAMVKFSNFLGEQKFNNCVSTTSSISFTRGETAYFWAGAEPLTTKQVLADLPPGTYWDAIVNTTGDVLADGVSTTLDIDGKDVVALFYLAALPKTSTEKTTLATTLLPTTTSTTFEETTGSTSTLTTSATTFLPTTTEKITTAALTTTTTTTERTTTRKPTTTTTTSKKPTTRRTTTHKPKTTTTSKPKTTTPRGDWKRTVIFIKKKTHDGQEVFLRGGNNAGGMGKKIPIVHNALEINIPTRQRDGWAEGDNYLDWDGKEPNQNYRGKTGYALGTPAQWTTNNKRENYYSPLNKYGKHYWMVDVQMDCMQTEGGFFELKGIDERRDWETLSDVYTQCRGGRRPPRSSHNHFAECGKINVFEWGKKDCSVYNF